MIIEIFDSGFMFEFKFGAAVLRTHDEIRNTNQQEMELWCKDQFGSQFTSLFNRFYFDNEADRIWFILRWS
jgi:hypothetical protein